MLCVYVCVCKDIGGEERREKRKAKKTYALMRVCVCLHIYTYTYTHIHTHTYLQPIKQPLSKEITDRRKLRPVIPQHCIVRRDHPGVEERRHIIKRQGTFIRLKGGEAEVRVVVRAGRCECVNIYIYRWVYICVCEYIIFFQYYFMCVCVCVCILMCIF
jgi:hypothetical protein